MENRLNLRGGVEKQTELKGDGSYDSKESVRNLIKSDVVVTNPPFSLIKEYVPQLLEHKKKFLIIAPQHSFEYAGVRKALVDGKIWQGVNHPKEFDTLSLKTFTLGNARWMTNLEHNKWPEFYKLEKRYSKKKHPKIDDYNAIYINSIKEIPYNYAGNMAVPFYFLDKYNPNQFELIHTINRPRVKGQIKFKTLVIKNKFPNVKTETK